MRVNHVVLKAQAAATAKFGRYAVLTPSSRSINISTPSSSDAQTSPEASTTLSNGYQRPYPVPPFIPKPSYVPVNFWTRKSDSETLWVDDEHDDDEGWKGDVQNHVDGQVALEMKPKQVIELGGLEEETVRYAAGLARDVLKRAGEMIEVSFPFSSKCKAHLP